MYCHLLIMAGHVYLVARVSSATLDNLATFETLREDMEADGCDEPEEREAEHDGKEPELEA